MPRGIAKYTLDQLIEKKEEEIIKNKQELSVLKAQLIELKEKKKNKEIKELQAMMSESELSVSDIKQLVKAKKIN